MSNFDYASRLTEMVLLGNVAIPRGKADRVGRPEHAGDERAEANRFVKREYRKGWVL
jgi:hypothetical protein